LVVVMLLLDPLERGLEVREKEMIAWRWLGG
jgi:hypothetical protein